MASDMNFDNICILVTGASSGIGSALVAELLGRGACVGAHYHKNKPDINQLCSKTPKVDQEKIRFFKADLRDFKETEDLFTSFIDWAGRIDGLVNNAGDVYKRKHFLEVEEEDMNAEIALNLKAPFWLSKLAIESMERNNSKGSIVNISSVAAKYGGSLETLFYGLSKASLEVMTLSLMRHCAPLGIRINALRLGVIDTPFHLRHAKNMKQRIQMIPAKRMGQPEEAAWWIMALLDQKSAYINGQVISLTGGE